MSFRPEDRERCARAGFDIDQLYREFLLEIRVGGPAIDRLAAGLTGGVVYRKRRPRQSYIGVKRYPRPTSRRVHRRSPVVTLSPRQVQVLANAAAGMGRKESGQVLYIAPDTVREHLKEARRVLGVRSTTAAVAHAIRGGYIE